MSGWGSGAAILRHRRSLLLLATLAILGGCLAALRLPVALFPAVHFPRVVVDLAAGDRPGERMAVEITAPVEEALRALPGVAAVDSLTTRGEAQVSVTFGWDQDMDLAALRTRSAVNQLLGGLPAGTTSTVRQMDPTVFPSVALSLTSPRRTPGELRALAWNELRPRLATLPGVAGVDIQGGAVDELQVLLDEGALRAHGLAADQVVEAVGRAAGEAALGQIEDHGRLLLALLPAALADADPAQRLARLRDLPLRVGDPARATVVPLSAVAQVVRGGEPAWTRVSADGRDAVAVQIYQQPGANGVAVSAAVAGVLRELAGRLPADVAVATWYDHADLITAAALGVRDAVVVGTLLASLVLFAFLRDWRVTLVALVAVPASLGATVLVLAACHRGFDLMTLGGMAAAVGLIIDDAIVMVEHLMAATAGLSSGEAAGESPGEPAGPAAIAREALRFAPALAGSSAATLTVFVPLTFLPGLSGAFFTALALTMAIGLVASFLASLLVVPAIVAWAGIRGRASAKAAGPGRYTRVLRPLLARPWLALVVALPLAAAGAWAFAGLGSGFMPSMDEGGFILDYRAKPGTALSETDRLVRQVEALLRATPEVATYARRTGLQLGGGVTEANEGDFFVRLKRERTRGCAEIMDAVREQARVAVPGLEVEMAQLMEDLIGDLVANPHPVEVMLADDDPARLATAAHAVAGALEQVPGVVDVSDGLLVAGDALEVRVDPVAAAREGLDADAIARQVGTVLAGTVAGAVVAGGRLEAIRVWSPPASRSRVERLAALRLRAPDGHDLPLSRVAALVPVSGQPQITHHDLRRAVSVTARISGRDLGSTITDVRGALARDGVLPAGMDYRLGGLFAQQQQAFNDLATVLVVGVLLLFLLLVALYERLRVALAVLLASALAVAGVALGLRLCAVELNLSSLMGLTMVVGIATEVAVLFVSAWAATAPELPPAERLTAAGEQRARPILMTVIAAVLALLPLAVGWGEGSELLRPLAIAIIAGLVVQLPVALVVLPLLLRLLRCR